MPNTPRQTSTLSFKPADWSVRLQKPGGTGVEIADEVDYLIPLEVHYGAGSQRLPRASFRYDLGKQDQRIVDQRTPADFSRELRVVQTVPSTTGGLAKTYQIFDGDIAEQALQIGRTEAATIHGMLSEFHFGGQIYGPRVWDVAATTFVDLHTEIVFNPQIDSKILPNMNAGKVITPDGGTTEKYHPWMDPESVRTDEAIEYGQGEYDAASWTLEEAVQTLCWICNPNETYVKNPTLKELSGVFVDAPDVKNIHIRRGNYLPQILDELLRAHGYMWSLVPRAGGVLATEPSYSLKCFKLGKGIERDVLLQRPGSQLTRSATNVREASVLTSIAEMANVITAHGALKEYEGTFELFRGWPESEDSLSADDLDRTADGAYKDNQRAWRLWVLNEAGDYCNTRTHVAPIDVAAFSFNTVFDTVPVPKRRRFYDCLSYKDDTLDKHNRRRKPYVQYLDPEDTSGGVGGTWKEVPSEWGTVRIHEHMCAIQFDADRPPDDLIDLGENARIRVTATIVDDERITATADRQTTSPQGKDIVLFLDVSDRFFKRTVVSSDTNASIFAGQTQSDGSPNNDARDDSTDLQTLVDEIQAFEDAAVMRIDLVIAGINVVFQPGDLIRSINGRNVNFNRKSLDATTKLYPQVFGVTYDYQRQATILEVRPTQETELRAEIVSVGHREAKDSIRQGH